MKITLVLEQNLFPLHDGLRKQVWFHALSLRKQHPKSDIQIINIAQGNRVQDEISIIGRRWWNMFFFRTDILHYFGSPSPIVAGLLLFSGYKKAFLSITDGAVSEFWKSVFSRQSVFLIRRKVSRIFYFTEYQRNILATYFDTSILCRVLPYIEHFTPIKEKSPHPRLLFMSHLSKHKGIDVVLEAYVRVLSRYPNLELVVADSGLQHKNAKYYEQIDSINNRGGHIVVKKQIEPQEELSESWIYLYTFTEVVNTMAVPISLYEAIGCQTLFISSDIGGVSEYFPEELLLFKIETDLLVEKIFYILEKYSEISLLHKLQVPDEVSTDLIFRYYIAK